MIVFDKSLYLLDFTTSHSQFSPTDGFRGTKD